MTGRPGVCGPSHPQGPALSESSRKGKRVLPHLTFVTREMLCSHLNFSKKLEKPYFRIISLDIPSPPKVKI